MFLINPKIKINKPKNEKSTAKWVALFFSVLVGIAFFVSFSQAATGINKQINYQGKLTDGSGVSVADGSYNFKISLYTVASGGTPVWTARGTVGTPTARAVTLTNGMFSIMLGDTVAGDNAMNVDFSQDAYYLGITVGTDAEMTSRKRIGAVPQAFNSNNLIGDGFINIAGLPTGNTVSGGTVYVNPASATAGYTLLGLAVNGTQEFKVDAQGNVSATGNIQLAGGSAGTVIGGTGVTDILKLQGTSGNGTATSPAIQLNVGNSGGTTALTVLNNGNVGIGTTSPSSTLSIYSSGSTTDFTIGSDATGHTSGYFYTSADTNGYLGIQSIKAEGTSYGDIVLNAAGGSVGIGTTSPTGTLQLGSGAAPVSLVMAGYGSTADVISFADSSGVENFNLTFDENANTLGFSSLSVSNMLAFARDTGYVGIGTSSPQSLLDVAGLISSSGVGTANSVQSTISADGTYYVAVGSRLGGIYTITFDDSNRVDRYTVAVNGSQFDENMSLNILNENHYSSNASMDNIRTFISSDGSTIYLAVDIANRTTSGGVLTVTNIGADAGNVGIGSLPVGLTDTTYYAMAVERDGYVGIGTTGPNHKLDVAGNIGLSASSYINFGATDGTGGYGLYDNAGTLQYKNSGGSWANLGGGGAMAIGGAITSATQGSILFAGTSGVLAQNNANFFWDNSTNRLGIGTATPAAALHVAGTSTIFGTGEGATPSAFTLRGAAATGSNIIGGNFIFDASNGTGSSGSGDFIFRTAGPLTTPVVTLDASSHNSNTTGTTLAWSHTVGSNSNRFLLVGVMGGTSGVGASSVTYGAASLTKLGTSGGYNGVVEIWYLVNPTSGTDTITITMASSCAKVGGAASWYNVDQSTPVSTSGSASGSGNGSIDAVTLSSAVGNKVFGVIQATSSASMSLTGGLGQTALWFQNPTSTFGGAGSVKDGAASTTISWTLWNSGASIGASAVAVSINHSAIPPNTTADTLTERLRITSAGNVGIGTASPGSNLEIMGATSDSSASALNVKNASGTSGLFVRNDGHVGIGTTSPMTALQVAGSVSVSGDIMPTVPTISSTVVDSGGNVGQYTSTAIGSDGFSRISYYDVTNHDLKFVQCTNAACSTKNIATLDSTGDVGQYSSIAISSADTFARIAYYDLTNTNAKFIQCTNSACSTKNTTVVDSNAGTGKYTAVAIGTDGFARIAYASYSDSGMSYLVCSNASCSSLSSAGSINTSGAEIFQNLSLDLDSSNNFNVAYYNSTDGTLNYSHGNTTSAGTGNVIDSAGNVGQYQAAALGSDGIARMSYYDVTNGDLKFAQCSDVACSSSSTATIDSTGDTGQYTSIAVDSSGNSKISYYDVTNGDLKTISPSFTPGGSIGSSMLAFSNLFANNIGSQQISTTSANITANALTTGTALYAASSSLTSGYLADLEVSGTAAAASQTALNILTTGANATNAITTYGAKISNTHTNATSGTNVALYLNASGATTANYGLVINAGNASLAGSSYLNFGSTNGASGYGIYDNAGTLQYKNSGGSWANLGGSGGMAIGGAVTSGTLGSVYFGGTAGALAQDNSGFFYDATNHRLGLGTTAPAAMLSLFGTSNALRLSYDASHYANLASASNGDLAFSSSNTAESALVVGSGTAGQSVSVQFDGNSQDYYTGIDQSDSVFKIGLGLTVGTTPYLSINSTGNIGIGTVTPGGTLSVVSGNTTGLTTSSALNLSANSLTTGTGLYAASSTLTSGKLVDLQVSGNVASSTTQTALNILTTGTITGTVTTYGSQISNTHSGGTSTNVGLYLNASGATNNYGLIINSGFVGVGTTAPTVPVHVTSSANLTIGGYGSTGTTWGIITSASRAVSVYAPNGAVVGSTILATSDQRLKENVTPIDANKVDSFFNTVNPVDFRWIADQNLDTGFIAQDLIKEGFGYLVSVAPDSNMPEQISADGFISPAGARFVVNYGAITPLLTAGIQKNIQQINTISNQISALNLKTDTDISSLSGLQTSVDSNLLIINGKFTTLDAQITAQATTMFGMQAQIADEKNITDQLQTQINLIKEQNKTIGDFIAILDPTKIIYKDSLGNLDLLDGKLEAAEVETGILTIKIVDVNKPSIGQAIICPKLLEVDKNNKCTVAQTDENNDGFDDNTKNPISDGKSVEIKTRAVSGDSKIFTSFVKNPGSSSWVEKTMESGLDDYTGFKIIVDQSVNEGVNVDWWIVQATTSASLTFPVVTTVPSP